MLSDRYARQRLLAAVGDSGQARIAEATYAVALDGAPASRVERDYLERAGGQRFVPAESVPDFTHGEAFRHECARDFAAGAWRALIQLRHALEHGQ
jgi:hypothetical protein